MDTPMLTEEQENNNEITEPDNYAVELSSSLPSDKK